MCRLARAIFFVLLAAGCGGSPLPAGDGRIRIELPAASLTAADVARVLVTVSSGLGPAFTPFSFELTHSAASWVSSATGLPAGPQRQFDFQALDSSGAVQMTASVRGDVPPAGALVISAVLLPQPTAPTTSYLPVIDALTASSPSAPPGGSISLSASAHAPEAGDTLAYAWQASCGTLSSTTVPDIQWTAPATSGSVCTISLKVSGRSGSVAVSTTLSVQ